MSCAACWVNEHRRRATPDDAPESVAAWAEEHVRLVGSARSESYRADITPWTRDVLERAQIYPSRTTFIKPIQSGGTSAGEIAILYWLSHWPGGDIQYNWPNGSMSGDRWSKHVEKKLMACRPVMDKLHTARPEWRDGLVVFPHCNFMVQGAGLERSFTADSIRGQVNEELHDEENWIPGRLQQAYRRTTAYWNPVILNISNAGRKGSELHQAFMGGTQRHWEVKCPGCGKFHRMRARWEPDRPELGGLRYDIDAALTKEGEVDYENLCRTIRYQMPCGKTIRDNVSDRRTLSLSGRYSAPDNPGATHGDESYTLEAVSVDYIPWLDLVRTKHLALRSMKRGDPKPFFDYLREQECRFVDQSEDRPVLRAVQVGKQSKNREGLPNRTARFAAVDRQRGSIEHGELPHWWLLIQDVAVEKDEKGEERIHFLIVWEGRCMTDEDVSVTIREHAVNPLCVVVDSSHDSGYVYGFCLKHGYNAVKIAGREPGTPFTRYFKHEDGSHRIFSVPKPLHEMLGQAPSRELAEEEPEFWHISLHGALDRLHYLRSSESVVWEVPSDASPELVAHLESWEQQSHRVARTNETVLVWKQVKKRDDLLWCCAAVAVQAEMAEIVGAVANPMLTGGAPADTQPDDEQQKGAR